MFKGRGGDGEEELGGINALGLLVDAEEDLPLLDGCGMAFFIFGGIFTNTW